MSSPTSGRLEYYQDSRHTYYCIISFYLGLYHKRNRLCSSIGQLDETLHEAVREWLRVLHVPRVLAGVGAAAAGPQARHHLGGPAHRQGGGQGQGGAAAGEDFFVSKYNVYYFLLISYVSASAAS